MNALYKTCWRNFPSPTRYRRARPQIRTGDAIAMADGSLVSLLIRRFTRSDVGHVALVFDAGPIVELLEAIKTGPLRGEIGVSRLSQRIREYESSCGNLWWLPLSAEARARMDEGALLGAMVEQQGRDYDWWQALCSGTIFPARPDPQSLFCSESIALAFSKSGVLPATWNYSETSPQELIALKLYATAVPLVGDQPAPRRFNYRPVPSVPLVPCIPGAYGGHV